MAQRNDIEDVLSSIRRLVANEAGTAIKAQASHALVLDQTQRVTEPEDPFQTVQGLPDPVTEEDAPEELEAKAPNLAAAEESFPVLSLPEPDEAPLRADLEGDDLEAESDVAEVGGAPIDLSDISASIGSDEALRELIAEIVRQELAGALGERITRNVRKLVRRELRLMMSGEEFD